MARARKRTRKGVASDKAKVIAVARNTALPQRIESLFRGDAIQVSCESSIDRALERFESEFFEVLVVTTSTIRADDSDEVELLDVIVAESPATEVLLLVEARDIRIAISAVKAGAYQYAKLPLADNELRLLIKAAIQKAQQHASTPRPAGTEQEGQIQELVGNSQPMQDVYRQIRLAAVTDIPVLLLGKTGTGKDLAATAIHRLSDRKVGPFVAVNLGALPKELVASELFGHEKGAFTGATNRREGKFEQARDGTVFLDEVGTIDEKVQVSLLRLIDQKGFYRLGGKRAISTNARLIAASNQGLADLVRRGQFREDLYYRFDVFRIVLPPLQSRHGDIPLLVDTFLRRYNQSFRKHVLGIAPECLSVLESYEWPGNVRELKNVIQRAVLVCEGETLLREHLPGRFRTRRPVRPEVTFEVGTPLDEVEQEMVIQALAAAQNNRTRAAELLAISRRALYNKLRKYGIR